MEINLEKFSKKLDKNRQKMLKDIKTIQRKLKKNLKQIWKTEPKFKIIFSKLRQFQENFCQI